MTTVRGYLAQMTQESIDAVNEKESFGKPQYLHIDHL